MRALVATDTSGSSRKAFETVITDTLARSAISLSRTMFRDGLSGPMAYRLAPRQCNLTRKVSKKELSCKCISRTLRRLRPIVISSPAESSLTTWPSALKMVTGVGFSTLTHNVELAGRTSERCPTGRVRCMRRWRRHERVDGAGAIHGGFECEAIVERGEIEPEFHLSGALGPEVRVA